MIYFSDSSNPNSTTIIIFECSDIRRDTGLLLLLKRTDGKFELHLHNDYTHQAIAMILDIKDFARMFESLEEYFQSERADRDMTSNNNNNNNNNNTIVTTSNNKKFTISLTKAELDNIQKQFLEELDAMLDKVRKQNNVREQEVERFPHQIIEQSSTSNIERKIYRYDNERDNVTVTLSSVNKNQIKNWV